MLRRSLSCLKVIASIDRQAALSVESFTLQVMNGTAGPSQPPPLTASPLAMLYRSQPVKQLVALQPTTAEAVKKIVRDTDTIAALESVKSQERANTLDITMDRGWLIEAAVSQRAAAVNAEPFDRTPGFLALVADPSSPQTEDTLLRLGATMPTMLGTSTATTQNWVNECARCGVHLITYNQPQTCGFKAAVFFDVEAGALLADGSPFKAVVEEHGGDVLAAITRFGLVYVGGPLTADSRTIIVFAGSAFRERFGAASFSKLWGHKLVCRQDEKAVLVRRVDVSKDLDMDVDAIRQNPVATSIFAVLFRQGWLTSPQMLSDALLQVRSQVVVPFIEVGRCGKCFPVCAAQLIKETGWSHFRLLTPRSFADVMLLEQDTCITAIPANSVGLFVFGSVNWVLPVTDTFAVSTLIPALDEFAAGAASVPIVPFFDWWAQRSASVDDAPLCETQRSFSAAAFAHRLVEIGRAHV